MSIQNKSTEDLIELRLALQEDTRQLRDEIRAISIELDRRHDMDVAKKLAADLSPAQREALRNELAQQG
jgi:hypothetical protein